MKKYYLIVLIVFTVMINEIQGQISFLVGDQSSPIIQKFEDLLNENNWKSLFQLADSIIQNSEVNNELGAAYYYKAEMEIELSQLDLAHRSLDNAVLNFEFATSEVGLLYTHAKKGDIFYFQDLPDKANIQYSKAISFAKNQKLFSVLSDLYQKKAELYFSFEKRDSSILASKEALRYTRLLGEDHGSINLINQISTNYHGQGELDSAIHYFKENLEIKQRIDDVDGLISDLSALGNLYKEKGNYELAQEYLLKALNFAEVQDDGFSMTTIYSELGDIYADQSIWNVSEDYYLKAVKLAESKRSKYMQAGSIRKLGYVYEQQGKRNEAIEKYESALRLFVDLNNRINTAEVMIILSNIYDRKDQFDKIREMLMALLQTSDSQNDAITVLSIKMALAKIELRLSNFSRALSYANECHQAFEVMGDQKGVQESALTLSKVHAKIGKYREAYEYQIIYSELKDSLVNVERAEAIKKYALLATTQKKDAEISNKNKMLQEQQLSILKKNNQLLLLGGGLGAVGLLTLFILFIYFKNKQINKQRIQFLEKEKETNRLKAIIEGEEKERKRFARELHDGLGAVLATVKMQISSVGHDFPKIGASESYIKAEELIDDACRNVRDISHNLMPHVLEQQGLYSAIDDMTKNLTLQNDVTFDFIYFGNERVLNDVQKITLYRITQELLKNIINHANATEVIVQLTIEEDEIILIVEDNGRGFDPSVVQKGIGINNIISRTEYLNGNIDVESKIGKGSTFTIYLPLGENNSKNDI